jgi:O-antigen ligase
MTSAKDRLFSLGESDSDISIEHRGAEFDEARRLIAGDPLTGIGLGSSITFVSPLYDAEAKASDVPTTNTYVHDSYLFVALKMGLVAFVGFLLLLAVVTLDAYAGYRAVGRPNEQRLMLGGFVTIVALIGVSLTEPHLTYVGSAPLFVAAVALTQVVPRLARDRFPDAG